MTRDEQLPRRQILKLTGAAASTAFIAGCGGGDNGNGDGGGDGVEIDPGTAIDLDAQTSEWTGVEPSDIEGESNPTLILQADEDYEIGWTQGDGNTHNIELRDDNGEVVEDYQTEEVSDEEPDDQIIEFAATDEIVEYVCNPHESQMVGDIQIE